MGLNPALYSKGLHSRAALAISYASAGAIIVGSGVGIRNLVLIIADAIGNV